MDNKHVDVSIDIGTVVGNIIAFILSYNTWHSVGWAMIHGLLGWLYNIYFAIAHTDILKIYLDRLFGMF